MFEAFPKIPRLRREVTITEKIDGTNAQIYIVQRPATEACHDAENRIALFSDDYHHVYTDVFAGRRSRWIRPGNDNFGFALWVSENVQELLKLGPGRHFGEWWGAGIQRRYGLTEKRFSLFNVDRWGPHNPNTPACCHVVPVLARGRMGDPVVYDALEQLRLNGSVAAPGFMQPEGVVVHHHASRTRVKVTLEGDDKPKGSTE